MLFEEHASISSRISRLKVNKIPKSVFKRLFKENQHYFCIAQLMNEVR